MSTRGLIIVLALALLCLWGWWHFAAQPQTLISAFARGTLSPELFRLPSGVNEFDLLKIDGHYYFAYDDKHETLLRSAASLEALASAPDAVTIDGRYPTIEFAGGQWHVWAWVPSRRRTIHFSSSSFGGPYKEVDALPEGLADIHVRAGLNGKYFAAYKDLRQGGALAAGLLESRTTAGPWHDLGHVFEAGRAAWHAGEEADPAMFTESGHMYLTFAGWDGKDRTAAQIPAIVELDATTDKAIGEATELIKARRPWQIRNGQKKLFNPVFLCDGGISRIFYSQNVSTSGVAAGWGYLEAKGSSGSPLMC